MEYIKYLINDIMDPANRKIYICAAVIILTLIAEAVYVHTKNPKSKYEKKIDEAVARGHVIEANLDSYISSGEYRHETNKVGTALYEYWFDGERKTKEFVIKTDPPQKINMYYIDDPNKMFSDFIMSKDKKVVWLTVIPIIAALIAGKLLGLL